MNPAIEQLTDWKNQFNDKVTQVQDEMILFLTQRHISNEELGIMIRNTFSDFKISISDLLNTMTVLMKRFLKKSKKIVQNADNQWEVIVLDLNNQLEHVTRARAVEEEKRKELEKEVKMLRQKLTTMKMESMKPKDDYQQLVASIQKTNSPRPKTSLDSPRTPRTPVSAKTPVTPRSSAKKPIVTPKSQEKKATVAPKQEVKVEEKPIVAEVKNEPIIAEPPKPVDPPKEEPKEVEKDEAGSGDEKESRRDRRSRRKKKDEESGEEEEEKSSRRERRSRRKNDDEEEEEEEEKKERRSRRKKKDDDDEEEEEKTERSSRRERMRAVRSKRKGDSDE